MVFRKFTYVMMFIVIFVTSLYVGAIVSCLTTNWEKAKMEANE